jgi:hypothetical protein
LRALGAHDVIDSRETGWVDAVLQATAGHGVDVIIDHVGGPMLADNIRVLALKGRLVSVGRNAGRVGDCDLDEVARKRARIHVVAAAAAVADVEVDCLALVEFCRDLRMAGRGEAERQTGNDTPAHHRHQTHHILPRPDPYAHSASAILAQHAMMRIKVA